MARLKIGDKVRLGNMSDSYYGIGSEIAPLSREKIYEITDVYYDGEIVSFINDLGEKEWIDSGDIELA